MDEAFNRNKKGKEKEFVKEVEGVGKRNKRGYIYIYIYREREREREANTDQRASTISS